MTNHRLTIRAGNLQPVWAGHPWIFAQAVQQLEGSAKPGDKVLVYDPKGHLLGSAWYSPTSAIIARMMSHKDEIFDEDWLHAKLARALELRQKQFESGSAAEAKLSGYRWVHGEGDGLPGLIVDVLGDSLSVQLGTIGWHIRREMLCRVLLKLKASSRIFNRTSQTIAKREGFDVGEAMLHGEAGPLVFNELGLHFSLSGDLSQKTGYYFDQRPLREAIAKYAKDADVLDVYCYVGTIGIHAAKAGARSVIGVDRSAIALQEATLLAEQNACANNWQGIQSDGMTYLEKATPSSFDLVIVDPPKLAATKKQSAKAEQFLRKMSAAAARLVRPGGYLVVGSCSGNIGAESLLRQISLGLRDANHEAQVCEYLSQGIDHPYHSACPESQYLHNYILRVFPRD